MTHRNFLRNTKGHDGCHSSGKGWEVSVSEELRFRELQEPISKGPPEGKS